MGISFNAGQVAVDLSPDGDLAKFLTPGLNTVLHLGDVIKGIGEIPNAKLSDVPEGSFTDAFATDQEGEWDLGADVNVTISFQPELAGIIQFTKSGPVATFLKADESKFAVETPPNHVYVSIGFRVTLDVGGGLAFSAGNIGVKANLDKDDVFTVWNHRCFPEATGVFDALGQAFSAFKLPFLPSSVAALAPTDLLEFEFIGKLNLGMGLTFGLNPVQLGGRSAGEISRSFGNSFAQAVLKAKPTITPSVEFAVSYTHEDAFRFVFARDSGPGDRVSLTILRKDKNTLKTTETLGITLDAGAEFDFSSRADQALGAAVDRLFDSPNQSEAAEKLKEKLKSGGQGAVQKLTGAINDGINGLLQKATGTIELQLLQEKVDLHMALFRLHFDLNAPGALEGALHLAMKGDIRQALAQPAVELEPGSLVEDAFIRRSSFGLQLFDLWKWRDAVEYVDRVDVVYAGNGMLRLIALEGVKHSSGVVGHESSCDLHFLAQADQALTGTAVDKLAVSLECVLFDSTAGRIQETVRLLNALNRAALAEPVTQIQRAFTAGDKTIRTSCSFRQETFPTFTADPYQGNKPGPLPHPNDARNYTHFAGAVGKLSGRFEGFATYEEWTTFNRAANDRDGSTMIPDRRQPGNLAIWPSAFINVQPSRRDFMRFYSEAARHFMNLCEALSGLCQNIDEVRTEDDFRLLLQTLNGIVEHDVPVDFIKATVLALIDLSQGPITKVTAAADGDTLAVSFSISGSLAAHA